MFTAPLSIENDTSDGLILRGRIACSGPVRWMLLVMTVEKIPLERMWFLPHGTHTNKAPDWAPVETHRIHLPRGVSRRYAWEDNRVYPHDQNQEIARTIPENLMDVDAAISYFLRVTNISGDIPVPEYQATLGL